MPLKNLLKKKRETQFFLFSGKGGVGKTSVAAATALNFAKSGKKTLIISIDPAHSLSDSFDNKIGGDTKKLNKNLFAIEIDPKKAVSEYKEKLAPKLEKMDMAKDLGIGDMFDVAGMTPGIDEIAAFDKFLQFMGSDEYDIIIFDTAPTGHALRFLSLPDILDSWVGKMIKIRMKFSGVINIFKKALPFGDDKDDGNFGTAQLDAMKERIRIAKEILSNPEKTHYNIVTIPEQMSILESERSLEALKEYKIPVQTIIVNQLIPENPGCKFCTEKRKIQQERVKIIEKKFSSFKILKLNLFKEEINGIAMLERVGKELYK